MIDDALIDRACARLSSRGTSLRAAQYGDPVRRSYTFRQIRDGISLEELQRDFEGGGSGAAIYVIAVDPEIAPDVLEAFAGASRNRQRGYRLPRLNTRLPTPTMYVGSSLSLKQRFESRLHQHLNKAHVQTYALNMSRWCPTAKGTVHIAAQCISEGMGRDTLQDLEDALWLARTPMFGRLGSR